MKATNPVMFNTFGIKLPDNEYLFYQVINGEVTQVLNYKIIGDEIFFIGKDPVGINFNEKEHLILAKAFGSDTGVKHRLGFFNEKLTEEVLNTMAA
jgi:hypothetical protein